MAEPTDPSKTKHISVDEAAFVTYLTALSLSTQIADKLLPLLKPQATNEERKKFQFDLSILYLAIAGKAILMSDVSHQILKISSSIRYTKDFSQILTSIVLM